MQIKELTNEQRRQLIDVRQTFDAWDEARARLAAHFSGGMRWVDRGGQQYLLHKTGRSERSIGARSPDTEHIHARFVAGRADVRARIATLQARLEQMAPVNAALGLGRVPRLVARVLRRLRDQGLSGRHLHVVGTVALFAYEARAGVQLRSDLLATGDTDFLLDARRSLHLVSDGIRESGFLGVLRQVDRSFATRGRGDYRAATKDGFYIDLIRPDTTELRREVLPVRIGESAEDLHAAPVVGSGWLVSAPKFAAMALDESGFPVIVDTIDPRVFALHKAWLAGRPDRDPLKRHRDRAQARATAHIAERHLGWSLDAPDLSALPAPIRAHAADLRSAASGREERFDPGEPPSWW